MFPNIAGQQMPSIDFGQQRVNVPAYDWGPVNAMRNVDLTPLQNANDQAQTQLTQAQQRLAQVPNQQLQYTPPQPTDFENMMQQALQQRFMTAMKGENSFADRFDRGFDMGQKIAANTIVPALGVFGKGAAGLGAVQATESLKNHVHQAAQERSAQKQAINQTLMNLSAAYENLSPTSAKNAAAHLAQMLQYHQYNWQVERDAQTGVNSALQTADTAAHNLTQARQTGASGMASAYNSGYGNLLGGARVEQTDSQNNVHNQFQGIGAVQKQQEIGQGQEKIGLQKQEIADKDKQAGATNARENTKLQIAAMGELNKTYKDLATKMTGTTNGLMGGQKNPGYGAMIGSIPGQRELIRKLANQAGLNSMSDEDLDKMFAVPAQAPKPKDIFSRIGEMPGDAANTMGKALFGGGQQQAAPKVSVEDAATFLKKKQRSGAIVDGER